MKKHILIGAALLSLFASSCSNDDVIDKGTNVVTGKTISLNATINNGASTRLTYADDNTSQITVDWSKNESFTLYKGKATPGSLFTNTSAATGTFTGKVIEGGNEGDKYYAVYGSDISNTDGTLTINLSAAQVGTSEENGIKEFMLATASELNSSTTLTFDHKLTVLKMNLTLPEGETGTTASKVTVSGLHNKATYDLSKTTGAYAYTEEGKGDITAANGATGFTIADHKIAAYVAVFPEEVSANQITIKATVGDNEYSYTIASAVTLLENQVVPVQVTLAAPKTNFKSAYTADDYKTWSEANCRSAVSYDDMCKYLGAGVYWDNGDKGDNQQTYSVNGSECHTGLWVMKKAYIGEDVTGKTSATPTQGRPADINKYFFLPAAGFYNGGRFGDAGSCGYYWSGSPGGGDYAYGLLFYSSYANVGNYNRDLGCLPMVPE